MQKPNHDWQCPTWLLTWPGINAQAVLAWLWLTEQTGSDLPANVCINLRLFGAELGATKDAAARWLKTLHKCGLVEPIERQAGRSGGSCWRVLDAAYVAERRGIRLAESDRQLPLFDADDQPEEIEQQPLVVLSRNRDERGTATKNEGGELSRNRDKRGTATKTEMQQLQDLVAETREKQGLGTADAKYHYSHYQNGNNPINADDVPTPPPGAGLLDRLQWLHDRLANAVGLYRWLLTLAALAVETDHVLIEGRPVALSEAELADLIVATRKQPTRRQGAYFVGGLRRLLIEQAEISAEAFSFPTLPELARWCRLEGLNFDHQQQQIPIRQGRRQA